MVDTPGEPTGANARRPMPLFYSDVRPVDPRVHAGLALPPRPDFSFAAKANSVPVNGAEFGAAQRNYPIVFARTQGMLVALAVLGLRSDRNLFVEADGSWRRQTYIPAYIRRFPFVFIEGTENRFALAVEHGFLVEGEQRALFDGDKKPSSLLQGAMAFCGSYQRSYMETRAYFDALEKADLLVEQRADVDSPAARGQRLRLAGFHIIDEKKLGALPAETVADWHARSWLAWSYAHLFSQANWRTLAQITEGQPEAQ